MWCTCAYITGIIFDSTWSALNKNQYSKWYFLTFQIALRKSTSESLFISKMIVEVTIFIGEMAMLKKSSWLEIYV